MRSFSKKRIFFIIALVIYNFTPLQSQDKLNIKISGNNQFRYGIGRELLYDKETNKRYFENITDAKLTINNFTLGVRLDYINPAEIGRDYKGLRKRYIEFKTDNFDIRAGTFNEIFNRGLALNCYEQRELAFDTGLDGIRIIYKNSITKKRSIKIRSELLAGYLEYSDYVKPERIEKYNVKALNFEGTINSVFSMGFNFVYAKGDIPAGNTLTNIYAYLPEVYVSLNSSKIQLVSSYVHKKTDVTANVLYPLNFSSNGDGFYLSGNYSSTGIGITFEYKNYRFDLTTPDNQSPERGTKVLPFQNPPTALKQQTSALTSRISHPIDFNDDVGMQLDILVVPDDKLMFLFNAALSSRHYSFFDADTTSRIRFEAVKRKLDFLPSFDESYSPNIELSAEAEYDISAKLFVKLGLLYQYTINYNYFFNKSSENIKYYTIPAEARYNLTKTISGKLQIEMQSVKKYFGTLENQNYFNYFVSCSITRSPDFSLNINADFTTDKYDLSGKSNWIEAELNWKLNSSNIITIAYGSERGGLRCSGGICKFINPFNGFRLTVKSLFE